MSRAALAFGLTLTLTTVAGAASGAPFTYDPPGQLVPQSGSGRKDETLYAPGMRFPIESGPAYANSQVYGNGGGSGPGGNQCDAPNFSYPWRDNYCESRSWKMPLCPSGSGHQGQDIRAASCEKGVHWIVAAVDGTITKVGSYSVYLMTADGTRYDYLHMSDVTVKEGDVVTRGQRVGKVSNQFGTSATTVHLHFNIQQNIAGIGDVYVPPYASLVASYKELLEPTATPSDDAGTGSATSIEPTDPPPGPQQTTAAPLPPERAPAQDDSGCASAPGKAPSGAGALVLGLAAVATIRRRRVAR